jgi:hypothetical protein
MRISEGFCPQGHGPPQRAEGGTGWCEDCGCAWSISNGEIVVTLRPDTELFERKLSEFKAALDLAREPNEDGDHGR